MKKLIILFFCLLLLVFSSGLAWGDDKACTSLEDCNSKIEQYTMEIKKLQGEQQTLASTISYLNSKIQLTISEINKTEGQIESLEKEIAGLSDKIETLDISLDSLSQVLAARIEETYKRMHYNPALVFFTTANPGSIFTRLEYLKTLQNNDKKVLYQMETTRENFNQQKTLKEEKQQELKALEAQLQIQQDSLAVQKQGKQQLLSQTKNSEANFQSMLRAAMSELEAIQSIIAGMGEETEVGDVKTGDKIATVISGASACSTGTHLHFEVASGGAHSNPAGYLQSKSVNWDLCGWYGCDEPFGFSGSWEWPMSDPIRITQGYGMTAFARSGFYGGAPHSGIDMLSDGLGVKAVKEGKLYRGSIACGGGTLRYVRVDHDDSEIDTYYLHVNYY